MAMMNAGPWTDQDQGMGSTNEDDFQQFFNIGISSLDDSMQFDFHNFVSQNGSSMLQQQHHRDTPDTPMSDANSSSIVAHSNMRVQGHMDPMTSAPSMPSIPSQILASQQTPHDTISDIDAQIQFLQHQRLQQQQRQLEEQQRQLQQQQAAFYAHQRNMVPPTPQSLELHAGGHFFSSQEQAQSSGMFDTAYQPMKEQQQDVAFTPLVSPAVTPLEAHFSADNQFTIPGAYLSPITSPALHAQTGSYSNYDPRHSTHTSPASMDIESPSAPTIPDTLSKEVRRNNASKRKPKVRQSPITKPQRKKTTLTPVMNAQALSELTEVVVAEGLGAPANPNKAVSTTTSSGEDSENASVSPEALEMPPPPLPLPRSARQSPYIAPQNSDKAAQPVQAKHLHGKPSPATPASLFRISPRNETADSSDASLPVQEHIDNLELPGSINPPKPAAPASKTQEPPQTSTEADTPKLRPLQALPSPIVPRSSQPPSASQSPQLTPRSSTPAYKKTPQLGTKAGRKRASISSNSPALLPKISPNIKPLLPGTPGLSDEDSASRLLASKSNYQRILEGNTVPGVTYPSELSTNLTSKRTSHKIAEQGRRNRINTALQEIAMLLPNMGTREGSEGDGDSGGGDKKESKQSSAPNSKASTVESAIEYIKQLQQELAEANKRAEDAERKLQETKMAVVS